MPGTQHSLTVKELGAILDLCHTRRVAVLNYGAVRIQLHKTAFETQLTGMDVPITPDMRAGLAEHRTDIAPMDLQAQRDAEAAQKLIDDPLGFEQDAIDGHLRPPNAEPGHRLPQ